jgi:hypothetical protein
MATLRWRVTLAGLLLLSMGGPLGCAGGGAGPNHVQGFITPAHFRFQSVTQKPAGGEPGGWWAVCIHAVMRNGNTGDSTVCMFEVGLPMLSGRDGAVDLAEAQRICARRANDAAHKVMVLASPQEMTAVVCKQFKITYQLLLRQEFAPATVSDCTTKGLRPVIYHFNPFDFLSPL